MHAAFTRLTDLVHELGHAQLRLFEIRTGPRTRPTQTTRTPPVSVAELEAIWRL